MAPMKDILKHSAKLPEVQFSAGTVVIHEGSKACGIWILISGALRVRKGDELVNAINRPGAMVGEISLLLGKTYSATVEAAVPSVMRYAEDGQAFLASDPDIIRHVAVGLAERLDFVTTYLADLKHQYGDAPGLAMVSDVLNQLVQRQMAPVRTGSLRDPNPDY
jgi:CRP/FNR family cyclic AMP-dependent transcriptional regulator